MCHTIIHGNFLSIGVRDISATIKLPPNSFDAIDLVAADYDDMRRCCICKHICVFTAIACECNKTKVACIRHFQTLCKCSKKKKYALGESQSQFFLLSLFLYMINPHELTHCCNNVNYDVFNCY
jgi:hypothetical protein